jgi:amino acid transporter
MGLANALALLTSISLAAIATNLRVRGGGVYYLISRSLGAEFGGALGILLFVAQSVSIAFYCVGFGEVMSAILGGKENAGGWLASPQVWAAGAAALLFLFAWIGVDWATRLQVVIMGVLALALASFTFGSVRAWSGETLAANWLAPRDAPGFWVLFALFFPAVTGFTQGANLSGELRDPERSLPRGILAAVMLACLVYFGAAFLLAGAIHGRDLIAHLDAMKRIAHVGWIVDAGVVAAALSSALASFLGAPRILQSLAADRLVPFLLPFARCHEESGNPRRGTLLSAAIAAGAIAVGNLNVIAQVVSMFFLISYGLLNYATYVEARGASPAFRPRFRWFTARLSLYGALGCLGAMLAIDALAGAVALAVLFAIQQYLARTAGPSRWADGRRSYHFQRMRETLLAMSDDYEHARDWRPRLLTFCSDPERRQSLLQFASWIEGGSGLNTVVRILAGDPEALLAERERNEVALREDLEKHGHAAFARTVVAPDARSGLQLLLQANGVGPVRANTILLDWVASTTAESTTDAQIRTADGSAEAAVAEAQRDAAKPHLADIFDGREFGNHLRTAARLGCNLVVLDAPQESWRELELLNANERRIDVWWWDDASSRLMVLLAYLVTRSGDWSDARIRVLTPRTKKGTDKTLDSLSTLLRNARIEAEVEVVVEPTTDAIAERSGDAALVLLPLLMQGKQVLDPLGNRPDELLRRLPIVVLVRAVEEIDLEADPEEGQASRTAAALDEAMDAVSRAHRAAKDAERARNEAERWRAALELRGEDGELEQIERELLLATVSADRLERKARKAQQAAANAAAMAQELCVDSPRALRSKAEELAARTRSWRRES